MSYHCYHRLAQQATPPPTLFVHVPPLPAAPHQQPAYIARTSHALRLIAREAVRQMCPQPA